MRGERLETRADARSNVDPVILSAGTGPQDLEVHHRQKEKRKALEMRHLRRLPVSTRTQGMLRIPSPLLACLRLRLAGTAAADASTSHSIYSILSVRHASLTSAIGNGIRKSRSAESSLGSNGRSRKPQRSKDEAAAAEAEDTTCPEDVQFDEEEFIRTGNFRALPKRYQSEVKENGKAKHQAAGEEEAPRPLVRKILVRPYEGNNPQEDNDNADENDNDQKKNKNKKEEPTSPLARSKPKLHVKPPESIPYTTPASEFIYGTSAVEAALRCTRRKLYKLYIYQGPEEEQINATKLALHKLALTKGVHCKVVYAEWDRVLDKMSEGRPHNGVILEASPLPTLPITGFARVEEVDFDDSNDSKPLTHFKVELGPQSREEAAVNGTDNRIAMINPGLRKRYPLVLLLDGILDPGNLGAVIRSAYFLGVDAIAFSGRNSAPMSPVTIKASAGAAENMTLLKVTNNTVDFVRRSQENGWRFYAADAPQAGAETVSESDSDSSSASASAPAPFGVPTFNLLREAPTVIMLGSEGTGLSPQLRAQADAVVGIPSARRVVGSAEAGATATVEVGVESDLARVDSLNVSVAAALLMQMFLRHPLCMTELPRQESKSKAKKK